MVSAYDSVPGLSSAPVFGSRAWKCTIAAPAAALFSASTAHSSAETGTFGFSAFVDCSLIAASMISFSLRSNMPATLGRQIEVRFRAAYARLRNAPQTQ